MRLHTEKNLVLYDCGMIIRINWLKGKGKGEIMHLYSALHGIQTTLKCSGMDHTVLPTINTMPGGWMVCLALMH